MHLIMRDYGIDTKMCLLMIMQGPICTHAECIMGTKLLTVCLALFPGGVREQPGNFREFKLFMEVTAIAYLIQAVHLLKTVLSCSCNCLLQVL